MAGYRDVPPARGRECADFPVTRAGGTSLRVVMCGFSAVSVSAVAGESGGGEGFDFVAEPGWAEDFGVGAEGQDGTLKLVLGTEVQGIVGVVGGGGGALL